MNLTQPRHVYTVHLIQGSKGVELYYPEEKTPAGIYLWKFLEKQMDKKRMHRPRF